MSCESNEYILKRGEVGTRLEFTLKDKDGAVNMNGWTVTVTAKKGSDAPAIEDAACVLEANQPTTGKGKGYYQFDSTTANIAAGLYSLEFKGVAPGGATHFFPKSRDPKYARLLVLETLD
ncbi:MAG: hypothetical protein ACO24B_01620 [Ilumatobacteraceae bacterium]